MPASQPPEPSPPGSARAGLLALTAAGILWGSIGIAVRLLQNTGLSSATIAFWRYAVAGILLVALVGRRGLSAVVLQLRRPARMLLVAASSLAFQLLYFFAVGNIGAGLATLVTLGLAPVVLHVAEAVTGRTPPGLRTVGILVSALAGLVLVTTGALDPRTAPHPLLGIIQAAASGVAYACSTMWSRPLLVRLSPLSLTLVNTLAGALLLIPLVAVLGWQVPQGVYAWANVAWLGVVTTVVAYGLFYRGLRSVTGSTAVIVTLLEPVTAFVLAALLLGEALTVRNVVGGALVLLAVAALYLPSGPNRRRLRDR